MNWKPTLILGAIGALALLLAACGGAAAPDSARSGATGARSSACRSGSSCTSGSTSASGASGASAGSTSGGGVNTSTCVAGGSSAADLQADCGAYT